MPLGTNRKKPRATIVVPPSVWADSARWDERPDGDIALGVRSVGEAEIAEARSEAARIAIELHPNDADQDNRIECYNAALFYELIAQAITDPNDATRPFFSFGSSSLDGAVSSDKARERVSPEGARWFYDAIQRAFLATSTIDRELSDDEIEDLSLRFDEINDLPLTEQRAVRRMLGYIAHVLSRSASA